VTSELVKEITLFVLAGYVGLELIRKVPRILHTPLMSGANAISGVTLIGAIVVASAGLGRVATVLGFVAVVAATLNVVGGFLVTDRMLRMFRRKRTSDDATDRVEDGRGGGAS
jgi:NAD(P) transhydrogenase subunit alpha